MGWPDAYLEDHNLALSHEHELARVRKCHPGLLPLLGIALREQQLDGCGTLTESLRRLLVDEHKIPPRIWRLLLKASTRILDPLSLCYATGGWHEAVALLKLYAALELPQEQPVWMLEKPLALLADPESRYHCNAWNSIRRGAMKHAMRALLREQPHEAHPQELAAVLQWVMKASPRLDKQQRRAGWRWLMRQAKAWEQRRPLLEAERIHGAPRLLEPFVWRRYRVSQITTRQELFEEAETMRHCVFDRLDAMLQGECIVLSVHEAHPPRRRLATAELRRSERGWATGQVTGFANAAVGVRVREAVEQARMRVAAA